MINMYSHEDSFVTHGVPSTTVLGQRQSNCLQLHVYHMEKKQLLHHGKVGHGYMSENGVPAKISLLLVIHVFN